MAEIVDKYVLKGDASEAKKAAAEFEQSTTKAFFKAQVATQAFTKALGAVQQGIASSIGAAAEYERTNSKLAAALRNQGLEVQRNKDALNSMSSTLEVLTGISDEQIRSTQALALNMGVSIGKVDEFTRAAIRLSNTTGQNVNEAMKQLVKTTGGLAGELGETIPSIRNLTKEQLANGDAVRIINDELRDNLGLMTEGTSGAILRFTNAMESLGEALILDISGGSTIAQVLNATAQAIEGVTSALQRFGSVEGLAAMLDIGLTGGANLGDDFLNDVAANSGVAVAGRTPTVDGTGQRRRSSTSAAGRSGGRSRSRGGGGASSFDFGGFEPGDFFADEQEQLTEMIREDQENRNAIIIDLEERRLAGLNDVREANAQRQIDITNAIYDAEQQRIMETEKATLESIRQKEQALSSFASVGVNTFSSFANLAVDALSTMAKGGEVAFDKMIDGWLESQGTQLIASGLRHGLEGTARLALSYGADGTGYSLIGLGAVETGVGAAMLAGSIAIDSGGAAGTQSGQAGGGAARGATDITRPGSVAGPGGGMDSGVRAGPESLTVIYMGGPDERFGRFVRDSLREAS